MLLNETEAIRKQQEAIIAEYDPKIREAAEKANNAKGKKKEEYNTKLNALIVARNNKIVAFLQKCEEEEFKQITGGAKGIIKHAQKLLPKLIEHLEQEDPLDLANNNAAVVKNGGTDKEQILVNGSFAIDFVTYHLRLHIDALEGNESEQNRLFSIISDAVIACPKIDTDSLPGIDEADTPAEVNSREISVLSLISNSSKYGIMNDKATNEMIYSDFFVEEINGQMALKLIEQGQKGNKEGIPIYVALSYNGEDISIKKKLTAYDRSVYDAIGTCYHLHQYAEPKKPLYITPTEIYKIMTGRPDKDIKAPEKQLEKICASIDKMSLTKFIADISEQIKAYNLTLNDERMIGGEIETYLLQAEKLKLYGKNGKAYDYYKISAEPIVYTYNKATNHLLYVDYGVLDTSAYTSTTDYVIEFRDYFLREITLMKNGLADKTGNRFKRNCIIDLNTLYEKTGIQPPEARGAKKERDERQKDKNKIEGILNAFKAKNWIKGYEALNADSKPVKKTEKTAKYRIIL